MSLTNTIMNDITEAADNTLEPAFSFTGLGHAYLPDRWIFRHCITQTGLSRRGQRYPVCCEDGILEQERKNEVLPYDDHAEYRDATATETVVPETRDTVKNLPVRLPLMTDTGRVG
jgi:hypothetical protein